MEEPNNGRGKGFLKNGELVGNSDILGNFPIYLNPKVWYIHKDMVMDVEYYFDYYDFSSNIFLPFERIR